MKKLLGITLVFALLFSLAAVIICSDKAPQDERSAQIVTINEISQLIQSGDTDLAVQKAELFQDELRNADTSSADTDIFIMCGIAAAFMFALSLYICLNILRPFEKLKGFAAEIAKGNFDVPLEYERSDYFGAFTWAFDSMRKEITRSRTCEREAIENNKAVIAELSHDINTPIASIRAYAEGLEANLDKSPERRARYLSVIMKKCDEVSALAKDLLLHSLSDMDKLQMQAEDIDIVELIGQTADTLSAERSDVIFHKPDFTAIVSADRKRIMQLAENLINNARKYAHTDIDISFTRTADEVHIHFCDTGDGIPDEDMPFVTDKFYRGRNCGQENGSGLGLYIAKYIAKQSGGDLKLTNREKGLDATVLLPLKTIK